jgi:hypothetical protein
MLQRSIQDSVRDRAAGERPSLLVPVVEGNTLRSHDVAVFLKGRLSLLQECKPETGKARLI